MTEDSTFLDKNNTDGQRTISNETVPLQSGIGRLGTHPKEAQIEEFVKSWKAPQRLRTSHKRDLKEYFSLKQGYDGNTANCELCGKLFEIRQLQIHHLDHVINHNELSNLMPACQACNDEERGRWMASTRGSLSNQLKKENQIQKTGLTADQIQQLQLLKQAPTTFQKSVEYKQQTLAYMVEYVKEATEIEELAWDIVAIAGCSYTKAVEYINSYSRSNRSPFRQWESQEKLFVAPREWVGTDPRTAEMDKTLRQIEERRHELSQPVCFKCSKHFDPTEDGSTGRTCAACMKKGDHSGKDAE